MEFLREKNDKSFFLVCLKLGIGVLIYRGGIDLLSYVILPLAQLLTLIDSENIALLNSINYLYSAVVSLIAFLLGAVTLWIILRIGKRRNYQPTKWKPTFVPMAPFLIIATVALNFAMAEINAMLMALLYPGVNMSIELMTSGDISILEIALLLISTAVIPGIVEEIMFRGIILTNLAPYGRGMAVVTSALLFGLMHMNPAQFFYTTIMGLALGYIYLKTKSIWLCIIIHFTNNALGVIQQIIYQCNTTERANVWMSRMMVAVAVLGMVSIGVLLIARVVNRKKAPEEKGSFGRIYEPALSYEALPVTKSKKMLHFFSPSVSLFTVIVFSSMITTIVTMFVMGLVLGIFPDVLTTSLS